ncbi:MAG: hypothetical protein AB8F95_20900 [Bacteroidia bacterium]
MEDIRKMVRIQIAVLILFVFFKWIRSYILAGDSPELCKLFLLSFPNFCEGVIGVLTLTGFGIYLNKGFSIKHRLVYIIAILLAAIYVITQELKIHNLGGNNVYDPNDLIFSIVGLLVGSIIIFRLKPEIKALSQ